MTMTRSQVTTMIKTHKGRIWSSDTGSTVYLLPISEGELETLRDKIPFCTLYHGEFLGQKSLGVFFGEPTD